MSGSNVWPLEMGMNQTLNQTPPLKLGWFVVWFATQFGDPVCPTCNESSNLFPINTLFALIPQSQARHLCACNALSTEWMVHVQKQWAWLLCKERGLLPLRMLAVAVENPVAGPGSGKGVGEGGRQRA